MVCKKCRVGESVDVKRLRLMLKIGYDESRFSKLITELARIYKSGLIIKHCGNYIEVVPIAYKSLLDLKLHIFENGLLITTTPLLSSVHRLFRERIINFIRNVIKYSEGKVIEKGKIISLMK